MGHQLAPRTVPEHRGVEQKHSTERTTGESTGAGNGAKQFGASRSTEGKPERRIRYGSCDFSVRLKINAFRGFRSFHYRSRDPFSRFLKAIIRIFRSNSSNDSTLTRTISLQVQVTCR